MKKSSTLERAVEVLKIEAGAILTQIQHLDGHFEKAVQILGEMMPRGGQAVVMGIGKSGLVGRKIAATLSATGTPSIFLHPTEALHGDLGMIQSKDVLIVLSASGETDEIKKILPILREKDLRIIAITCKKKSRLARESDYVICSAVHKEACPLNLTPTSSTTAMLALGDALAICLMEKRGFKPTDFAKLHPGGTLGKKLSLKVKDLMRTGKENPIVKVNSSVKEALLEMSRSKVGATNIVNAKGALVGFFTDGDLRRKLQKDPGLMQRTLKEVMTKNPTTIPAEKTIYDALNLIKSKGFYNIPVVNKTGKPIGILDERDLLSEGLS